MDHQHRAPGRRKAGAPIAYDNVNIPRFGAGRGCFQYEIGVCRQRAFEKEAAGGHQENRDAFHCRHDRHPHIVVRQRILPTESGANHTPERL
jgi:hypothetical protein